MIRTNKDLSSENKIIAVCFSSKARKASITLHSALCTLHFALCTLHSALCTLHSALCTLPFALLLHFALKKTTANRSRLAVVFISRRRPENSDHCV